jgi:glycosyltransferase involved in cell wall biosynthesis
MTLMAIILTYNEAHHIAASLDSVAFADRRLVFDSVSTDATPEIAREAGAEVVEHPFRDYAQQRNAALDYAARAGAAWVLFVDADERVSHALAAEVREAIAFSGRSTPGYAGFRIPRLNYIFGRVTRGAGWFPDYQLRLLRVGAARYDEARQVHEVVELQGQAGTLTEPLTHYNYRDAAQFRFKQRRYAALDARAAYRAGVVVRPHHLVTGPIRHFIWRFVTLRGYIDGLHGLRLSLLMAWYELRKLRLLRLLWETEGRAPV